MKSEATAASATTEGRLGLALSGGGFRAAFFHIGVLARLAELGLLSQVEVISTVSGGSVVGAMYYLKLRRLLQDRADEEITPGHYVDLVKGLAREFQQGVEKNLRVRTFSNPIRNVQMYLFKGYSRSDRMARLYNRYFFRQHVEPELLLKKKIPLRSTVIRPKGAADGFKPLGDGKSSKTPNDRRLNKVPVLLLNTTCLNTGHNFRFTSTHMGEVPSWAPSELIDQNKRLRRMYLDGRDPIPKKYANFPLEVAVAASTAVPLSSIPWL